MSQEQEHQEQKQVSGYQDQTFPASLETVEEAEHQHKRTAPMNGYEFWLEVLKWAEDNWVPLLILSGCVLLPLLSELFHLLMYLIGGVGR